MWQRFELFWTAFEKFALFFSFLGTLTGLIFVDPDADNFLDHLHVVDMPLVKVPGAQLRPGPEALQEAMRELM